MQQVRCSRHHYDNHHLSELLTWVGRRLTATTHLAIHIDYPLWKESSGCNVEDPLRQLLSSEPKLNVNLETLDLAMGDYWWGCYGAELLGWLQDWVIPQCSKLKTISLALEKAPTWLMHCPTLRHLCLYFPRMLASDQSDTLFTELSSSLNYMNLPNLQTLFLQDGGPG